MKRHFYVILSISPYPPGKIWQYPPVLKRADRPYSACRENFGGARGFACGERKGALRNACGTRAESGGACAVSARCWISASKLTYPRRNYQKMH